MKINKANTSSLPNEGIQNVYPSSNSNSSEQPTSFNRHSTIIALVSEKLPNPKSIWATHYQRSMKRIALHTSTSLYIFKPTHPLRRFLLLLTENQLFDRFILLCIVINCVFLAMDDNPKAHSAKAVLLWWSELAFNILYTIEMVIKIIAWGLLFAGPNSYLKSSWNILDCVVVTGGWINMIFSGASNIAALRSLRLLKPLKAISSVPGMKVQVKALLSSIPSLLNVLALMTFLLFVFGILGMQLFGGKLRYRCVIESDNGFVLANHTSTQIYGLCAPDGDGQQCASGTVCLDVGYNPNNDVTAFDNILIAWLTILQCISLEGWTDVMYMIDETSGLWYDIYFVLLILFGSLFLINLIVAVILIRFKAFKELEEARIRRQSNDGNINIPISNKRISLLLAIDELADGEDEEFFNEITEHHITNTNTKVNSQKQEKEEEEEETSSKLQEFHENSLKPAILKLINDKRFECMIIGCILLNSLILSMDKYPMSNELSIFLFISNYIFTIIFAIEMILKVIGLSVVGYLSDSWNVFDGLIVLVSLVDICLPSSNSSFTALRTFRLLRVFKLLKFLGGLRELLETVLSTLTDLKYFSFILGLFIFIYALVGVQFFRGKFTFEGETSRANFDTFWWSSVTVFQILTGENWNEVLYDGVRGSGWWSSLYFISCFTFGNYIILSLFMAILLGNFEIVPGDNEADAQSKRIRDQIKEAIMNIVMRICKPLPCFTRNNEHNQIIVINDNNNNSINNKPRTHSLFSQEANVAHQISHADVSLGCMDKHCFLRKRCISIVDSVWFERFIMFLILVSSVLLCLDEPSLDPNSILSHVLFYADWVLTILFTLEMVIKIIASGITDYLRSGWNKIDCFIVIVSILNLFITGLEFIKGFRALRALRPLRMISRFENMKVVVNSIFATVPALGNVVLITMLFFYIFGIIGVQQFKGLYWYCVNTECIGDNECIIYKSEDECIGDNERWQQNVFGTFDNIFSSMLILFELATLEQWPSIMYAAIDSSGPGLAPERDIHRERSVFFIVFLLICSFFVLSLFVGVVVDEYQKYHQQFTNGCITEKQKEWLESVRHMINVNKNCPTKLTAPNHRFRKLLFRLVTNDKFELIITFLIGLNIIVMSLWYYDANVLHQSTLDTLNKVFTYIFIGEMGIKWIALGIRQYFRDNWNRFDAFIVLSSCLVLISHSSLAFDPTIARVLRITRIFRVVKRAKSLKHLLTTLVFSLPALLNVGFLLLLLFYIYAVAGMSLFGKVLHGQYINERANFESFGISMLTLYRMSTGESWNGLYHDCSVTHFNSKCSEYSGNCGSPWLATIYFLSFYVCSAMVMLNVFVAVVLKNFEDQIEAASKELKLPTDVIEEFEKLWLKFCEKDGELMKASRLGTFLNLLAEPLGLLNNPKFDQDLEKFIYKLNLPQSDGFIHYIDLGTTLTLRVYGKDTSMIPEENEFMRYLRNEMFRKFPKFSSFQKQATDNSDDISDDDDDDDDKCDEYDIESVAEQNVSLSEHRISVLSEKQTQETLDMIIAETNIESESIEINDDADSS